MSDPSKNEEPQRERPDTSQVESDGPDRVVSITFNPRKVKKYAVIGVVAVLAATAGFFVFQAFPDSTFSNAAEACFASDDPGLTIDDDGRSMYLNGAGEESSGMNVFFQVCILEELDVPDSVFDRISNTNSTMGVQEASWDNLEMSWTYHPDNGLNVSVDLK